MNDPMNEIPGSMPPPEPPPLVSNETTNAERQWAMFTHLSALAGLIIPFGNLLGPLILWQMKKNESAFIDDQGKEALNFQIAFTLALVVLIALGTVLLIILIGFVFYIAAFVLGIAGLVLTVLAGIRANSGELYRYPWSWRPIK